MDEVMELANRYKLLVIEDAAHSIDSYYKDRPLGSIGDMATFSFHETKNISCGEGGMLIVNDMNLAPRAEIIWEKGTNRAAFFRGEVDKYGWVDVGSSFLPSDLSAAFLFGQLDKLDDIQLKRRNIFDTYYELLKPLQNSGDLKLPVIPGFASHNGHLFYIVTNEAGQRNQLIKYLNKKGIQAVFHYLPLHTSQFYKDKYAGSPLPEAERYADCLLRLPFYYDLSEQEIETVTEAVYSFFKA
jgi:dTDP-4-amino-4,6-dideoxygalactose transaminase